MSVDKDKGDGYGGCGGKSQCVGLGTTLPGPSSEPSSGCDGVAEKTTQLLKCLLCKHGDGFSLPRTLIKQNPGTCHSSMQEEQTGRSWSLLDRQSGILHVHQETLQTLRWKAIEKETGRHMCTWRHAEEVMGATWE